LRERSGADTQAPQHQWEVDLRLAVYHLCDIAAMNFCIQRCCPSRHGTITGIMVSTISGGTTMASQTL
jgi:hypothetical protein